MNTNVQDGQDARLRASLTSAYPSADPSEVFKRRVQEETARRAEMMLRRVRRQRGVRLGLALAGATALTLLAVIAWPTLVAAQTLQRMESVMSDAQSAHITLWNVAANGTRTKDDETWYQKGKWRIEKSNPQTIQVFLNGKLWIYDPTAQEVRVQSRPGPFAYNPSGFSLGAYMHDVARWGWHDRIRVGGETVIDGRPVRQVVIDRQTERLLLLVDAQTDLPISLEAQRKTDHGFEVGMVGDIEINKPLALSLFTPSFPRTARVIDLDHGKQDWQGRLARGLVSRRVGDRAIVIRDLQVNAQGDVFLLYTADKRPDDLKDWDVEVKDEFGTRYLPQQNFFQPYSQFASADGPTKPGLWQGYLFDGVKLEGNLWTPAAPQSPWKPRRFTVTFHVPLKNEHGGWTEMWQNTHVGTVTVGKPQVPRTETVAMTQTVERPGCALTPDYMPYMGWEGNGGLDGAAILREDARVRLLDAWDRVAGQAYRAQKERNLPKALALNEQQIALETQIEKSSLGFHTDGTNTYAWFSIYQIQRELGRMPEARAALTQSRDEALREHQSLHTPPDGDPHWHQLQQALRTEGME